MWWGSHQAAALTSPQPELPPRDQSPPQRGSSGQAEVPAPPAAVPVVPSEEQPPGAPLEEEAKLRATLSQREAALLRQEGENYLLRKQVQQLERQLEQRAEEVGRDAQLCVAQLAQALQLLESANIRAPLKAEVDRARALVASARRGLGRLAGLGSGKERGGARSTVNTDRRSAPRGRPRSPRGPSGPGLHRPGVEPVPGLAASAVAAVTEAGATTAVPNGAASSGGCSGTTTPGFPPRRARGGEDGQRALRATSKTGGVAGEKDQRVRRAPPAASAGTTPSAYARMGTSGASAATGEQDASPRRHPQTDAAAEHSSPDAPASDPPPEMALDQQQQHLRQRALLAHSLRKSASLQEELFTMRDDLTRKDVIIHGLRQEIQAQRQELELQHQHFEHQQQQLQHQHQVQQLQQLQQLQELQRLLHQQQSPLLVSPTQQGAADMAPDVKEASLLQQPLSWEQTQGVAVTPSEKATPDGYPHVTP
uniref:Uncharacterized protein n=1 Tax=Alexandrium monilatum TaxID=311494 RepID=A0A7S4VUC3_9DINO